MKKRKGKDMEAYRQRVVQEKKDLDEKLSKLDEFIIGPTFASVRPEEQRRLNHQYSVMEGYSAVLGERIAAFD